MNSVKRNQIYYSNSEINTPNGNYKQLCASHIF